MTAVNIHSGKTVVREGDVGREFMIILSGTASVSREGSKFATLGPGDFFGTKQHGYIKSKLANFADDGEIWVGTWKNDKLQGRGETVAWDGSIRVCEFDGYKCAKLIKQIKFNYSGQIAIIT